MAPDDGDEGIGSAGTIPVEPDNPLYDAVKSGGGFVEDEDGNVSGGPDGDGTARTEEERTSNSDSNSGGSDGGSSGGETNAQKRNRLIRQSGSSGGSSSGGSSGGSSGSSSSGGSSSGPSGGNSSGGSSGSGIADPTPAGADQIQDNSNIPDSQEEQLRSDAVSSLNDDVAGTPFDESDVDVRLNRTADGELQAQTRLNDRGQQSFDIVEEQLQQRRQDRANERAREQAAEQLQERADADLDRGEDFSVRVEDGQAIAELTQQGREEEAVADRRSELAEGVPGASADDVVIEDTPQDILSDSGQRASFDDLEGRAGTGQTPTQSTQADTGEQSLADQGRSQRDPETGEAFGGRGEIEQGLRDLAGDFRTEVSDPVGDVTGDLGDLVQSGAAVSAASNPALILSGSSDPGTIQDEVEQGPDRVEDLARAPDNEQSSERAFERFGEGVGQGAAGVANAPQLAVTGIEVGEVARAGAEATVDGELGDFTNTASAAGAVTAADAVEAAEANPAQFAGQLSGGAVVGAVAGGAASSVARRAARQARRPSGGQPPTLADDDLGSGGTGSLLDADALDESRGVSGPSTRSRIRGRIERELDLQGTQPREFVEDRLSAQLGITRERTPDTDTPDAPSDFDPSRSEILEGSPRDRLSDDIAQRSQTQRQQNRGTFDAGDDPLGGGVRRRRDRAQRSEVRQTDDLDADGDILGFSGGEGAGAGFTAGLASGSEADAATATDVGEILGVNNDDATLGADRGAEMLGTTEDITPTPDTGVGVDTRLDIGGGSVFGGTPASATTTTNTTSSPPQDPTRTTTGAGPGGVPGGNQPPRPDLPDFDSDADEEELFGGYNINEDTFDSGIADAREALNQE